jgi:hypothetical protein
MSALAISRSFSVSAVQGNFRWLFVCWLEGLTIELINNLL